MGVERSVVGEGPVDGAVEGQSGEGFVMGEEKLSWLGGAELGEKGPGHVACVKGQEAGSTTASAVGAATEKDGADRLRDFNILVTEEERSF